MSKFKRATAMVLISLTALSGAVVSAEAHSKKHNQVHFKFKKDHEGRNHWNTFRYSSDSCGYYYDKWQWTGSGFWKGRYYSCIYGW